MKTHAIVNMIVADDSGEASSQGNNDQGTDSI